MRIRVSGAVQGVGFRPFVYREAMARNLDGFVTNTPQGVTIEVEGDALAIAGFIDAIETRPPPNAIIAGLMPEAVCAEGETGFAIRDSVVGGAAGAAVLPDLATCDECLAEISDPRDRRFGYPFTNCTHCGPRFSIIRALPYDRARTTMAGFVMCDDCRKEYEDPADRRFHAEPIACPACGPRLALWGGEGTEIAARQSALHAAASLLREGRIVAVKGLGGFHLMVDARNDAAVRRLRQRKLREEKPFAVMFASLDAVRRAADVSALEETLLTARERPIVLLRKRGEAVAGSVAPGNPHLGAMLPYTPLHHLLLAETGFPVVATSGNRSDEPIVTDEDEAGGRLGAIADAFLVHDRPIVRPVDDSVVRAIAGRPMVLRRARGYAPAVVAPSPKQGVLAVGGHLKATVALGTPAGVVLSQHLGDLDTPEARDAYDRAIRDIRELHDTAPALIARDLHPDYHSTRVAEGMRIPAVAVQHHVAHVAACMAEFDLEPPVLGVAWDGTGYGPDGTVWGGEFLLVTEAGWRRAGHLRPFRLPGGEAAVREPRRSALGLLHAAFGADVLAMTDLAPIADFTAAERTTLRAMLERGVNAPLTSSAGRLFDAVAALTGLRQRSSYEGQAAMELEWAAVSPPPSPRPPGPSFGRPGDRLRPGPRWGAVLDSGLRRNDVEEKPAAYPVPTVAGDPLILDWEPALRALLADFRAGEPVAAISAKFHAGLAAGIAELAAQIGEQRVVLTGGCFQNARLMEATIAALTAAGMTPIHPERVPPNDGGIALGQLWWASRFGSSV